MACVHQISARSASALVRRTKGQTQQMCNQAEQSLCCFKLRTFTSHGGWLILLCIPYGVGANTVLQELVVALIAAAHERWMQAAHDFSTYHLVTVLVAHLLGTGARSSAFVMAMPGMCDIAGSRVNLPSLLP